MHSHPRILQMLPASLRGFFPLVCALFLCTAAAQSSFAGLNSQEQALLNLLANASGQKRPFVKVDPVLSQVARARAADMANRNYFGHTDPDGRGPNWHVQRAGYKLPASYGTSTSANYIESIGAGQTSASSVWSEWMGSSGHRTHLLASDSFYAAQTSVGIGYVNDSGSRYGHYWVVITAPPQPSAAVTITSPAAGAKVSTPQVTISGTTSGSIAASFVQYRVENASGIGAYVAATGVANWSGAINLTPGPNTIRVRSLNAANAVVAETSRAISYVILKPLTVNIAGEGTITTGFAGTTQREVGRKYTITATPKAGQLFAGWSGSTTQAGATLNFTMAEGQQYTATFIPNPFLEIRGGFTGLLQGASGHVKVALSANGAYTGKLLLGGKTYSFKGKFALDGRSTASIKIAGREPMAVSLQLDFAGSGVAATITDGAATYTAEAESLHRTLDGDYAKAGRYTISLPPPANAGEALPLGDGYALLTINRLGRAKLSGSLADGRAFTFAGVLSHDHRMVFHIPLYAKEGGVTGALVVRDTEVSDLDGAYVWSKPERPDAVLYPEAWEAQGALVGSRYVKPIRGTPVIEVPAMENNSTLTLGEGNLEPAVTEPATLDPANRVHVSSEALKSLKLSINATNGRFSGSFVHPVTRKSTSFKGVIFQKQNGGFGYFLGADQGGYTTLTPASRPE